MPVRTSAVTATVGEHLVAARLAAMGYVVALPRGGSPAVDLLVSTPDGSKALTLQVKTSSGAERPRKTVEDTFWEWPVGPRTAEMDGDHLWYAFVDLRGWPEAKDFPQVFLVPSKDVSAHTRYAIEHKWSRLLFRLGHPDGEEYQRANHYLERWDRLEEALLGKPTDAAPI